MEKELLLNGKKIYCRFIGNGEPVLLVHGFGEDGDVWKHQAEFLKDQYRLIIPDLPGSGSSAIVDDMSIEGMAQVLKNLLDAEGITGKLAIIGHSMGGYITLAIAEKYPGLLNRFGLFHSSAYADSEEKKDTRRKGIAFVKVHGAYEFIKTSTPNLFSPKTRDERPELVYEQIEALRNFSGEALVLYYQAMMQRPDRTFVLEQASVPVLFIIGEDDNAIPVKDQLEQSHLPRVSVIHILENCGHMGMLEKTRETNNMLFNFLAFKG